MGSSEGEPFRSCIRPSLDVDSFQDITTAIMPALLPREGVAFENSSVPFFPGLPKDKAWDKLPNTI
jgi:hypothetical protein